MYTSGCGSQAVGFDLETEKFMLQLHIAKWGHWVSPEERQRLNQKLEWLEELEKKSNGDCKD